VFDSRELFSAIQVKSWVVVTTKYKMLHFLTLIGALTPWPASLCYCDIHRTCIGSTFSGAGYGLTAFLIYELKIVVEGTKRL